MVDARRIFGDSKEVQAARMLEEKGMKILERQFKTRFGEIDLIAKDGSEIVFVEVKARRSVNFGFPEESVTTPKLRKITLVGEEYLSLNNLRRAPYRIDVVAIIEDPFEIRHIEGVGG
ncbi:MAG: YraN family protein [Candidatus Uhrbacteria bacterium]|nr:YraN family protein [Candidatus Uhrbacteria bacterium]